MESDNGLREENRYKTHSIQPECYYGLLGCAAPDPAGWTSVGTVQLEGKEEPGR